MCTTFQKWHADDTDCLDFQCFDLRHPSSFLLLIKETDSQEITSIHQRIAWPVHFSRIDVGIVKCKCPDISSPLLLIF